MILETFVGGANELSPVNADAETSINLYPATNAPGKAKTPDRLTYTPGYDVFCATGDSPIRGEFSQDGRAFAVCGELFVEVFTDGSRTILGTVTDDGLPASMASNGTAGDQVLVISGGEGYILTLSTSAFAVIADADFPHGTALMCDFMDGYFLVLVEDSRQFVISALEDGTSWDPLDVAERSEGSDNIQALKRNHREIWLVGTKTTEVWYDNGDPLFPFAPIQGVFIETGTVAPWSVLRFDNTIGFLGQDERGSGMAWRMDGYTPQRISTEAIETYFQSSTDLSLVQAFAQQQRGHLFVWWYVPDLDKTPVYDAAMGLWHFRALWNPTTVEWEPEIAQTYMFAFGKHLLGARNTDTIYELSLTTYTQNVVAP